MPGVNKFLLLGRLAALGGALTACAPRISSEPLRYPALPPAPSASSGPAAFVPAASLTALQLACRPEELPQANALDDDCNGQVDDAPTDDPLSLAIAYPRASTIVLSLRTETNTQVVLAPTPCDAQASFCTVRLPSAGLSRGRLALLARWTDADAMAAAPSVVVSVQSRGKVTAYLAKLGASAEEQALGELALR